MVSRPTFPRTAFYILRNWNDSLPRKSLCYPHPICSKLALVLRCEEPSRGDLTP